MLYDFSDIVPSIPRMIASAYSCRFFADRKAKAVFGHPRLPSSTSTFFLSAQFFGKSR